MALALSLARPPEHDVAPRGPVEEYWWQRIVEAEWARLFGGSEMDE